MAATKRILCYAKGLIYNDIDCKVIITQRTEKHANIKNFISQGFYEGTTYQYIPSSPIRSNLFLLRRVQDIVSYFKTIVFFLFHIKRKDYVHLYSTFDSLYLTLLILCKIKKIKITRELCEYPHVTKNDSIRNKLIRLIDLKICFPLFSGFVVISTELEKVAKRYGSSQSSIIKIPILIDTNVTTEKYSHSKPYIFHGGTMLERKDAIVSTMKAFAMASKRLNYTVDFILIGPASPHKKELEQIIYDNKLQQNVYFKAQLPNEEIIKYQNGAALSILNKNDNLQNRCGFSTKLGEILLSATPVITTTIGEANYYLRDNESAYIVEPHRPDLIAQKIFQAFSNEKERISIGLKGKQIAEKYFDYKTQGKRYKEFISNLLNN